MVTQDITPTTKNMLRQIALLDKPGQSGFTLWYEPELPSEFAGCYMPCVPPRGIWQNDTRCSKEELDKYQESADILTEAGALQLLERKNKEDGGYYAYYLISDQFESVYQKLDPEGFDATVTTIKKSGQQK